MESGANTYVAVVDDDESLCRSLGRLLNAAHMRAITYLSAEAFLADTKHPQFDCLLLDIQLGGISGIDLQKYLVAHGSRVPVIFITAHDDPATRNEAMMAGCAAYFPKTEPGANVLEAIRQAVAQS